MKANHRIHRLLAMVLALVMVIAMFPSGVIAAGTTIAGSPETVKMGIDAAANRENDFNKGWKFYLGDNSSASNANFDDSGWDDVDLPHDFSITQHFTASGEAESGFLPGGTGWYRKHFVLDEQNDGKTFLLNFDGVYMHAYIYVNGKFVGEHHYGYTSFAFDITEQLVCDGITENVVAVKAVNQLPSSRWYSGSGIYRDVTLYALDPVHADLNGVTVTTPDIADGDGTANVKVDVVNDGSSAVSATVTAKITEKGSDSVLASASADVSASAGSRAAVTTKPVVSNPKLWSVETPNLYTLTVEVSVNGETVDSCDTDFGYRWTEWNSTGFHLNGKAVKLNGVCMHHDQGGLGSAAYYDAMYRQMSIMKDMGANAIRTAHNPADEDLISICNELGLLVIEEAFDGLTIAKNSNSNDFSTHFKAAASSGLYGYADGMTCAEYAARSMMKRDRNAPAVIAWSMGNEIQEGASTSGEFVTVAGNFITWSNAEDGTHPVTIGDNTRGSNSTLVSVINTLTGAGGIAGFNYANSASTLYSLSQSYGGSKGVIIASETSSATNSRGRYMSMSDNSAIDGAYHLTSYDTSKVSWGITAHDSIYNTYQYDCVAGEFVWTGFDYIGEPTPWNGTTSGDSGRGAIPNSSYFGIVETTGFPKDTYYLYRSQWNKDATTVHLVTAWDSDNQHVSGGTTPVWMYSNAPTVELWLNDAKIATSTRGEHTSDAGHTYYTYTSVSNNSSVCTVSNGSGADALYGAYNVVYTAGTLTAKAFDENGTLIDTYSVTTPGTVTKLQATANRTEIDANGYDLVYVEVDVTDANGVLDTTAANNITFTVNGPAVIAGVDNGDQATVRKYQNSYVLTSDTTANINAYAGKALVILRATGEGGEITLSIASNGLEGQTINITSVSGNESARDGLTAYTMIRDYSVKAGTQPTLDTAATGTLADGSTVTGSIAWESIGEDVYGTAGDYTIRGVMALANLEPMYVTAKLHVIPNIIDLRNVSAAVMEGNAPTLPDTVRGVMADGTQAGEFAVEWKIPAASEFDTVGEIATVTGTAVVFGDETMDVTCTVRVAEAVNTESVNVAGAAHLSQDIPTNMQSDNLNAINDGVRNPGENTNARWTNWSNRYTSDTATITLRWDTAQVISDLNMFYRYDNGACSKPDKVVIRYSLDGVNFTEISHTESALDVTVSNGAAFTYALSQPINPVAIQVTFTQTGGTTGGRCVGLYELEAMTYAGAITVNTSADLSGIAVDGTAIEGFDPTVYSYEVGEGAITVEAAENVGITVLPAYEGVVRILTVSEDGSAEKVYAVTVGEEEVCGHANTEVRGAKTATCTEAGYSGDTYCTDCGEKIAAGSAIAARGHTWDNGVITKEPTEGEVGVKTFTCTVCGETRTEAVRYQAQLKAPAVTLSLSRDTSTGKIVITGRVEDYENLSDYCEITEHGLIFIKTSRIGSRLITLNTSGRTKVSFAGYTEQGTFSYSLKPTSKSTMYAYRAFVTYTDPETGKSVTVYSDMLRGSYNTLAG